MRKATVSHPGQRKEDVKQKFTIILQLSFAQEAIKFYILRITIRADSQT